MRTRRAAAPIVAALAAMLLAGCTAQPDPDLPPPPEDVDLSAIDPDDTERNGLWYLSGDAALREVITAARDAGGVTMDGTITEKILVDEDAPPIAGRVITIAMSGTEGSYTASFSAGAITVQIVAVDGAAYVTGNPAYAAATGVAELASGFVCVTPGDPLLREWTALLSPADVLESLISSGAATASVTPPRDAEATTVDIVLDSGGSPVGVLTVSAVGPPLPLSFAAGDTSGDGSISFTGWGEAPAVEAPATLARDCG